MILRSIIRYMPDMITIVSPDLPFGVRFELPVDRGRGVEGTLLRAGLRASSESPFAHYERVDVQPLYEDITPAPPRVEVFAQAGTVRLYANDVPMAPGYARHLAQAIQRAADQATEQGRGERS